MNVEVLQWPADEARVDELRRLGRPRLLVVALGPPPDPPDCLEDWIGPDASSTERELRSRALSRRADIHGVTPLLDEDGLVHFGDAWVALSPVERSLAGALLDRYGSVVPRDVLARRAWPRGMPTRNALDVHVLRLRRRIKVLGLEIRTVRSRGYLLQLAGNRSR